jgi:hypothetical protein
MNSNELELASHSLEVTFTDKHRSALADYFELIATTIREGVGDGNIHFCGKGFSTYSDEEREVLSICSQDGKLVLFRENGNHRFLR